MLSLVLVSLTAKCVIFSWYLKYLKDFSHCAHLPHPLIKKQPDRILSEDSSQKKTHNQKKEREKKNAVYTYTIFT